MEELLTRQELMEKLKIKNLKTVDNWISEGMPSIKLGRPIRFRLSEVLEWFKQREEERENVAKRGAGTK